MEPWPEPSATLCGDRQARQVHELLTVGLPKDCAAGAITWFTSLETRNIDTKAYERRLVTALERMRVHAEGSGWVDDTHVTGQAVWLEGTYPDTKLILTLVDRRRGECTFGFRARVWNKHCRPQGDDTCATPEEFAGWLLTHLDEIVTAGKGGLPTECAAGEITWVSGGYPWTYFD